MARKGNFKTRTGSKVGAWRLVRRLGEGGNGEVWEAQQQGQTPIAIKFLKRTGPTALARFDAETAALKLAETIAGVVPLLDRGTAVTHGREVPWFSMPLAKRFNTLLGQHSAREIVQEFVKLAGTLAALHKLEIFHRDIKPENILVLGERLCFSDFGLVKFPTRTDLTPARQDVGPKFTMAPEMRRAAAAAAGGPVDVYSLAKTLWIALSGEKLGFDGQYSSAGNLALARYWPDEHMTPLDELLSECTDNDPKVRPSAEALCNRLADWVRMSENFDRRNLSEWTEIQNRLFPSGAPQSATWTDIDSICSVLRLAGQNESLNHMFFPDGGGMTMSGVSRSADAELIELKTGFLTILKPLKLTFESFAAGSQWNYFRLEATPLAATGTEGAYVRESGYSEEVWELSPGRYAGLDAWDDGEFLDDPDAHGARRLHRMLKGSFVIFSTSSPYNRTSSTYDARHEKMSEIDFREYMQKQANRALERRREGTEAEEKLAAALAARTGPLARSNERFALAKDEPPRAPLSRR
ncbi:protein kinase [Sphingopyxis sp.]|uniref:protein kinase domain-containing protein n=1 Tax=Sphingopyxis sp. TaxID=1908224 RepID=UPI00260FF1F8|nr:protein kinase [Sphingopyxis sp.]MCW0197378.1 protein kinase [Sphingopyxis sp.]